MADYAIHDTTLIAQANIIRKKFGTTDMQDPADYADKMNLMGLLEEKTASGSIVTFSDGADDVPLKSCEVALPASLDGYSNVDVVQCGKNIFTSEIETGNINSSGENEANNFRSRTKDYIRIPTDDLVLSYVGDFNNGVFWYDKDKTFISYLAWGASPRTLTPPTNAYYVRFSFLSATYPTSLQLEKGTTPTAFEVCAPTTHTASLGRTIYGGIVDVVKGEGTDENGNDFTFSPVEISSRLGNNTMWSDGDMSVVYRASGTVTKIAPLLRSKAITENGTYSASDDGVDGYDAVVVNVPSIQSIAVHSGKLNIKNGTITEDADYCYTDEIEFPNGWMRMDFGETSNGDFIGIEMLDNGTHNNYWVANDRFRSINLSSYYSATKTIRLAFRKTYADVVVFIDYGHSKLYSPFTMLAMQEASTPSLLSMSPSEEVNENTEEVEENEQNDVEG